MAQIPADLGGMIRVVLRPENGRIGAVEIASSRPVRAARIFVGKPVAEMTGGIGRVFSLCGKAQTVAALRAAEAALGLSAAPGVEAARDVLRLAEMMTQTAMRLALHWPRVLGLAIRPDLVRAALAAETALADAVAGPGWTMPGAGVAVAQMPDVATLYSAYVNDPLLAELQDALAARGLEDFGSAGGGGLSARLAVSGKALTTLPQEIAAALAKVDQTDARPLPRQSGQGEATVETARGPLTHRVRIEDGIVADCQTEAPTEANFAPDGPVVAGLAGAAFDPVAAELHVLAIDPCVACSVEVADA
jgi:coenzyme F420-reducing hydrogenase alpha subunit